MIYLMALMSLLVCKNRKAVFISSIYGGNVLQQRNPKHDDKLFKSNRVNCINQIYN